MGQIESAIDKARRSGQGKSGPWEFRATSDEGVLIHYGTPIFKVNLKTGAGEVGAGAWGSVSDQTGIRKAAAHLSSVLGVSVSSLNKKGIIAARERARGKGEAFSNPRRLGKRHVLLDHGNVYCPWQGNQAPPILTYSGVKCPFCGETISSMHGNPCGSRRKSNPTPPVPGKVVNESGKVLYHYKSIARLADWLHRQDVHDWATVGGLGWSFVPWTTPTSRAQSMLARQYSAHLSRQIRGNPLYRGIPKTGNHPQAYVFNARNYKEANEIATKSGMFSRAERFDESEQKLWKGSTIRLRRKNPMPSFALILRRKLAKGYPYEQAVSLAERELQQAAEFLRVPYSESHRRNPPTDAPQIYGRVEKIFATKTGGDYRSEKFVHDFKPGVEAVGLPARTTLKFPGGETRTLPRRAALLVGRKDVWRNYK